MMFCQMDSSRAVEVRSGRSIVGSTLELSESNVSGVYSGKNLKLFFCRIETCKTVWILHPGQAAYIQANVLTSPWGTGAAKIFCQYFKKL